MSHQPTTLQPGPPASCVTYPIEDPQGNRIQVKQGTLGTQTATCFQDHGHHCPHLTQAGGQRLGATLWAFPCEQTVSFSFTNSSLFLSSLVRLETEFGELLASPEREFLLWSSTGLCQGAPLVLTVDGVRWRLVASAEGVTGQDVPYEIPDSLPSPMKFYLKAFRDGGEVKRQTLEAVSHGHQNLLQHREILYKVFHIMGHPPTRSHDLTKTPLVNFCLGRCFHAEGLGLVTGGLTFDEVMTFAKFLHVQIENHHPESSPCQQVSVLDMYVDRVGRGVEKSVGWSQEAWSIPDKYTPPEYRDALKQLENTYKHLALEDPGPIDLTQVLSGELSLAEP